MAERTVLSVSDITREIKTLIEQGFSTVSVEGEVSNFRPSARGHWYFVLKDDQATLSCVMFAGDARKVSVPPRDGDLLRLHGSLSVYAPRGAYQLVARRMEHGGTGAILAMLEDRKRQFQARGLFDRHRALPTLPGTVAVVTSPTGAAIRDILQVLRRRKAPVHVRIVPAAVQGNAAAAEIAQGIRYADRHNLGDVIVGSRGGGSLEDLLAFSDEAVVRALAETQTPTISAVGHEVDWALSDFAADQRAPTPSAAAEIVCAGAAEIQGRLRSAAERMSSAFLPRLARYRRQIHQVGEAELRYRFRNTLQPWYQRFDEAQTTLHAVMGQLLVERRRRLQLATERVDGASPYRVLERGYAIVRQGKRIITRREQLPQEGNLSLQFADGSASILIDMPQGGPQ